MSVNKILKKITVLFESGPILPGGIRTYYNVCGTPGCKCKDKENPKKHGPYHQLSYSVAGHSSSMFVKNINFPETQEMVKRFKALKHLINLLALEYAKQIRKDGFDVIQNVVIKFVASPEENAKTLTVQQNRKDTWKEKATIRRNELRAAKVKIRDLENSRSEWKEKAQQRKTEIKRLQKELAAMENQKKMSLNKT
jgi:hypothetical protein